MSTDANTPGADSTDNARPEYPPALAEAERRLVERRPGAENRSERLGVALSGGGIRSATFALGFFQALAHRRADGTSFLRDIDFLSTVSGGGYFGGFFTALFVRNGKDGKPWDPIEEQLGPRSEPVRYLRENGNYLAPAGSQDLLLGGAVLLRNWLAVLTVLVSLLVAAFLALEAGAQVVEFEELPVPRAVPWFDVHDWLRGASSSLQSWSFEQGFWLSPWILPAAALLLVAAIPIGGAYWIIDSRWPATRLLPWKNSGREGDAPRVRDFVLRALPFLPLGLSATVSLELVRQNRHALALVVLLPSAAAFGGKYLAECCAVAFSCDELVGKDGSKLNRAGKLACLGGFSLIVVLQGGALVAASAIAAPVHRPFFGWIHGEHLMWSFLLLVVGDATAQLVAVSLLRVVVRFRAGASSRGGAHPELLDRDRYARHRISRWLGYSLLWTAALLTATALHSCGRTLYAFLAQDMGWLLSWLFTLLAVAAATGRKLVVMVSRGPDGKRPGWIVSVGQYAAASVVLVAVLVASSAAAQLLVHRFEPPVLPGATAETVQLVRWDGEGRLFLEARQDAQVLASRSSRANLSLLVFSIASLAFGFSRRFLNNSTHLALYSARITRTFLGASNRRRWNGTSSAETSTCIPPAPPAYAGTHLLPDDDIDLADYFRRDSSTSPYHRGAPLHLINVTINETVDGRSQIQQNDRKGLNLAIGPCGMSAGVRHHAVFSWDGDNDPDVHPRRRPDHDPYQVFADKSAATSHRTLLSGLERLVAANRRFPAERLSVGRWLGISGAAFTTGLGWRTNWGLSVLTTLANVRLGHWWRPGVKGTGGIWRQVRSPFFWVQQYLLRELWARFPGTAHALWYLSDGGHFENTGAYELLRRRLPRIILVDAEADPDYEFEGLGNLVRKARLDFGAHIDFEDDVDQLPPTEQRGWGRLADLKRCRQSGLSKAHAALARITYANGEPGWLLYVKPTLTGDEPVDLLQYRAEQPTFPQQTTIDQIFDETQWESYRRLGEHIGEVLFAEGKWPVTPQKQPNGPASS